MAIRTNGKKSYSHPAVLGVLVLVFGGLLTYALVSYAELRDGSDHDAIPVIQQRLHPEAQAILNQSDSRTNALQEQSSSDEVAAIDADLRDTVLSDLDADTGRVMSELQGL